MEKLQPKLRFPEFKEVLVQKKFKDCFDLISGYAFKSNYFGNEGNTLIIPKNFTKNGYGKFEESFIKKTTEKIDSKFHASKDDLLILLTDLTQNCELLGNPLYILEENLFYVNQRISKVVNSNINKRFLTYYLLTNNYKSYIKDSSTGTTVRHSSNKTILNYYSWIPSLEEQTKIADFLGAVDKQLDILSQKKEKLNTYKKGAMQQLFSQQLRFKDDNGNNYPDWRNTKIGEVCQIKRGASPRPISNPKWFNEDSSIGWVRISDVTKSKNILYSTEQYLSKEGISKSRLVKKDNLIMSICATIGKPIYTGFDVCIHDGFVVFENLNCNHQYLFYYLDFIQDKWYRYGQPGTQINLNSTIVSDEYFPLPNSLEEQTKIANFLSAIDNQIQAVENKIIKTETYKKGLLQQMFV